MPDRCLYGIDSDAGDAGWVCSLSDRHEGDHYLIRPEGGRVAPIAPDPERDRRRTAYAAARRARAARALDEWFRAVDARGWVAANFLLAELLRCMGNYTAFDLQHKSNYGVSPDAVPEGYRGGIVRHPFEGSGERCDLCDRLPEQHRNADYVAPRTIGDFRCVTHGRRGCEECGVPRMAMDYGATADAWCECDWLGEGTPRHAPSPTCIALRPDGPRS